MNLTHDERIEQEKARRLDEADKINAFEDRMADLSAIAEQEEAPNRLVTKKELELMAELGIQLVEKKPRRTNYTRVGYKKRKARRSASRTSRRRNRGR